MKFILQRISKEKNIPTLASFKYWVKTALNVAANEQQKKAIITIRIVNEDEIMDLNLRYRNKKCSTNVLSFGFYKISLGSVEKISGDIIICAPIIIREAQKQNKNIEAHFAHLTIHGILHLLGYDHKKISDAKKMEHIEIITLKCLGVKNPYDCEKI